MPGLHRTMLHNLLIVKFKDHMADCLSVLLPLHRQAHIHRNLRTTPGSIRTTRTTSSSTAASARKWNHHSPGSLRRPFHRIRSHIHNNLRKKLHVVFLRRSKLDTDQLHPGLPDLMRGALVNVWIPIFPVFALSSI